MFESVEVRSAMEAEYRSLQNKVDRKVAALLGCPANLWNERDLTGIPIDELAKSISEMRKALRSPWFAALLSRIRFRGANNYCIDDYDGSGRS